MDPFISIGAQYVNDELEGEALTLTEMASWEREISEVDSTQEAKRLARRIRSSRRWSGVSDVVMVDPDIDPDTMGEIRADALAVSALLAVEANNPATEPDVHEWRETHLGSGVRLAWDEVESWVDETGARDGEPTSLITFAAPPGVMFERMESGYVPSHPIVFDAANPLMPFRATSLLLSYGIPGATSPLARRCSVGGVLDHLRGLSEELADRYRWSKAQASTFVMTGLTPVLSPVSIETRTLGVLPAAKEVSITVRPTATPEDVNEAFREARNDFFGTRTRSIPPRQAHLVLFRLGRLHHQPDEKWTATQAAWNERFKSTRPKWVFTSAKQVKRDFHSARQRLLEHERRSP